MGNLSYCRFENTARDLQDCYEAINDGEIETTMSDSEVEGLKKLMGLIQELYNDQEYIFTIIRQQNNNFEIE